MTGNSTKSIVPPPHVAGAGALIAGAAAVAPPLHTPRPTRARPPAGRSPHSHQGRHRAHLDRAVGDFAQADVLIEDGKIREVRPNIAADAVVVDAGTRILSPGFVDTHSHSYQGLLRTTLPNGLVDPDYNRDVQNNLTHALFAGRRSMPAC
jgi:hypothetical protein